MTPGSVVLYKNFQFYDGGQSDKLLIVLNTGKKSPYLVVRTTSQAHQTRPPQEGCHHDKSYYFIPARRSCFPKDTWVLFYEPYVVDAGAFLKAKFDGKASIKDCLKEDVIRAIINCFRKSSDCSDYHLSLLD